MALSFRQFYSNLLLASDSGELLPPKLPKVIISCPGLIYELHAPRRDWNKCVGQWGRWGPTGSCSQTRGRWGTERDSEWWRSLWKLKMEGWWLFEVSMRTEGLLCQNLLREQFTLLQDNGRLNCAQKEVNPQRIGWWLVKLVRQGLQKSISQ